MSDLWRPIGARVARNDVAGTFSLRVYPVGLPPLDLNTYRGAPTQLSSFSFTDPFGSEQLTFTLPAITAFDRLGHGELAWVQREMNLDLVYSGEDGGLPPFRWEGYVASWDYSTNGLAVSCKGALYQLDNELGKPEYPAQPLPYEVAIARCFINRPDLRVTPLKIEWPSWWKTLYAPPVQGTPNYMIPSGVTSGKQWTGMLTRSTGSWDPLLTGYIQSLLTGMYTERGRLALDLDEGRIPVLRHRDFRLESAPDIPVVDLTLPGNTEFTLTEDWTQSANVAYGQGTSLSGVSYTGMDVSPDGLTTTYYPLAATRQVHPVTDKNGWFQRSRMRKEVMLTLQPGLDALEAQRVAVAHIGRFGEPGVTGNVPVGADPTIDGVPIPRHLLRAGMSIQCPWLFGAPEGLVLHITHSSMDFSTGKNTLTVDSRYRDRLTVDEVRKRGRDALNVPRLLVSGTWSPPVPDMLLPWNYAGGSGCIPSGPQLSSYRLFRDMPASSLYPWADWLRARPPKSAAWRSCYIRIGPATNNANFNWAAVSDKDGSRLGIPIKMSQAGTIRLLQLVAVDADGNLLPVGFHFSLYYSSGVNYMSMPSLPQTYAPRYPPYAAGQHYPFFPNAWERFNEDGTQTNPDQVSAVETSGLIRAWGSSYEKAGYFPGSSASGDAPTGMLVDEAQWSFDTSQFDTSFDPYSATRNLSNPLAGLVYAMIWCDMQGGKEVFFTGRMFRVEPGAS